MNQRAAPAKVAFSALPTAAFSPSCASEITSEIGAEIRKWSAIAKESGAKLD